MRSTLTMVGIIIVQSLVIAYLLYDKFGGAEITPDGLVYRDTVQVEMPIPPVMIRDTVKIEVPAETKIRTKTVYKEIHIPDTVSQEKVNRLKQERDSLNILLRSSNYNELAILDTIVEPYKDSLLIAYSPIYQDFMVDIRFGNRSIPQVNTTLLHTKKNDGMNFWTGVGVGAGAVGILAITGAVLVK